MSPARDRRTCWVRTWDRLRRSTARDSGDSGMRFWSRHRRASLGGVAGARRPPTPSVQELRGAGGQHESEQPAAAGRLADVDAPAVRLDQTPHDVEAEAGAAAAA